MELRERIQTATKEAMKARDGQRLSTLRRSCKIVLGFVKGFSEQLLFVELVFGVACEAGQDFTIGIVSCLPLAVESGAELRSSRSILAHFEDYLHLSFLHAFLVESFDGGAR